MVSSHRSQFCGIYLDEKLISESSSGYNHKEAGFIAEREENIILKPFRFHWQDENHEGNIFWHNTEFFSAFTSV